MSNRHPDDPTLTEELLEQIEDGKAHPLGNRVATRDIAGPRGREAYDPSDPDPGGHYCPDVCIVGPRLIHEAVDTLNRLQDEADTQKMRADQLSDHKDEVETRVVAERRRGDEWEARALKAEEELACSKGVVVALRLDVADAQHLQKKAERERDEAIRTRDGARNERLATVVAYREKLEKIREALK